MPSHSCLYLIDGSSTIYRAYFALKNLSSSKGFPTNAIYGFTAMLVKLLEDYHPEYLGIVFDSKGPTFRHKMYDNYKATRPGMPDDLSIQIPYIKQIVHGFRINALELEGCEADDVIGTIAKQASAADVPTIIVSSDKDFCQLIDENISIFDPRINKASGIKEVQERFGVTPDKVVEVLGLSGDASDNIPGVAGIGEKTAIKLIQQYQAIENLYAHLEEIKEQNVRNKLKQGYESACLSKDLVAIDTKLSLPFDLQLFRTNKPDPNILEPIFKELEFSRFLKEIIPQKPREQKNYHPVLTEEDFQKMLLILKNAEAFSLVLGKISSDSFLTEVTGLAFSCAPQQTFYISIDDGGVNPDGIFIGLKPVLEDSRIKKYGHNIKQDYSILFRKGITLQGIGGDTLVASYLLNPSRKNHELKDIAFENMDYQMLTYADRVRSGKTRLPLNRKPEANSGEHLAEEAEVIFLLAGLLFPGLRKKGLDTLFFGIEMPLGEVLARMEQAGIKINPELLFSMSREFAEKLKDLEEKICALAGVRFNINSPQQLSEVLFEKLNLPVIARTKTGFSTNVDVLAKLSRVHEMPALVLEYRSLAKLKSTYSDALPKLINPETGRIHTTFSQTTTATGRLSSSDPNLQNIPIRGEWGEKIRQAFVTEEGFVLVSADYSQIELRIMAHLSGDKNLKEAFSQRHDVHTRTASEIFQVPLEEVTSEMRREAKVINFGVMYGMSHMGLSEELGITRGEAKKYIESYFQKYQGVKDYIDKTLAIAREQGYVTTLSKRIRYIPEINSSNRMAREFAERVAVNTPIQGTAADIIKIAMIRIDERIKQEKVNARMILQIHDELLFETAKTDLHKLMTLVREEMEGAMELNVPIEVSVGYGKNWHEAH